MALGLNFTAPLKQDPESQQRLQQLAAAFAEQVQPMIDTALAKSELVHFARILVIDNKYIQVLTEFDGARCNTLSFSARNSGQFSRSSSPW